MVSICIFCIILTVLVFCRCIRYILQNKFKSTQLLKTIIEKNFIKKIGFICI